MTKKVLLLFTLALLISTSYQTLADEDSKEAAMYGAFFESDLGWIQVTFTQNSDRKHSLEFELEGFAPDDFYLLTLVHDNVEMEIAILIPDWSYPPRAAVKIDETNWPMDFPRNFNEHTVFRVRNAVDTIIFEESLKPE